MSVLPRIAPRNNHQKRTELRGRLIRQFADIGGQLFGPVPKGHQRQFFCLDRHTWIWHEEWLDGQGKRQIITTQYTIRPNGILKLQSGQGYQPVSLEEGRNLYRAARLYYQRVEDDYRRSLQPA